MLYASLANVPRKLAIEKRLSSGLRGATVARLTPDQKVACSNHVGVNISFFFFKAQFKYPLLSMNLLHRCFPSYKNYLYYFNCTISSSFFKIMIICYVQFHMLMLDI